jgi:glutamine amidotransferase
MNVVVINYGMGNLGSVRRALEECGAKVRVSEDPADLGGAHRIVLPGVGAFADGMKNLGSAGWPAAILRALDNPRVALLGLCLGMHLLADRGFEGGDVQGLGLVSGEVKRLSPSDGERLPHVGWNEIQVARRDPFLAGIEDDANFYFVHSYQLIPGQSADIVSTTPYCGQFCSIVRKGNVIGTQFHPEKSSRAGFQLLRNFLSDSILDA